MSYFIRNGNNYTVTDDNSIEVHRQLPVGNYIIVENQMTGALFLKKVDSFTPVSKVYGKSNKWVDRILHTFNSREVSTGVMLNGEKGSGKTMLAKNLSIACANNGIATIIINAPWIGDTFNKLIQDINQPALVLFDEFEKVYNSQEQEQILTLFDGVFPTKKLFVITCNDKWRIDSHMRNRPGRIFYMIDFKGLDEDFIREYCEDCLVNKSNIENVCRVASLFKEFNFDMLKALVEEMNRYNETATEAIALLNAKPEYEEKSQYEVSINFYGKELNKNHFYPSNWSGNPIKEDIGVTVYANKEIDAAIVSSRSDTSSGAIASTEVSEDHYNVDFSTSDITSVDLERGGFVYKSKDGKTILRLTRKKEETFKYLDLF